MKIKFRRWGITQRKTTTFRTWRNFEIKKMDLVPQQNYMNGANGEFVIGSV